MWGVILLRDASGINHGIYLINKFHTIEEAYHEMGKLIEVNPTCKFDVLEIA